MERYKLCRDSIADIDEVYTIVGKTGNGHGRNRYVQYNPESDRPIIVTYAAYTSKNLIVFTNKVAAENFLGNFLSSRSRRQQYNIEWEIIQYKPHGYKSRLSEYELIDKFDKEYGYYYKLKLIETKYLKEKEKMSIDVKFVELDNKLLELDNLVLELKNLVKDSSTKDINCYTYEEALELVKALVEKHSLCIDEVYDYDNIVDAVRDLSRSIDDVYDSYDIEEYVKDNYCINDLYTEDEILDYVHDNMYPEDLVVIDWK